MTRGAAAIPPLLVTFLAILAASGCASPARRTATLAPPGSCVDLAYRARLDDAQRESPRRFKVRARACASGAIVAEVRGGVGGAFALAAARDGRGRVVVIDERLVFDGPDSPEFWREAIGFPWVGAVFADPGARGEIARAVHPWRLDVDDDPSQPMAPTVIRIEAPDGSLALTLERSLVAPADGPAPWPEAPASFERRVFEDGPLRATGAAAP